MATATIQGSLKAFSYLTAEKAVVYRAIMRVFTDAKARFALHLRPPEIHAALAGSFLSDSLDDVSLQDALNNLCGDWGNLEAHADTTDVTTVEDFYRQRFLYQLTKEGEAVERALIVYEETVEQTGELQTAALSDIRQLLGELAQLAEEKEPDEQKVHLTLNTLRSRFEELTSKAQTFIGSLQRRIDLQRIEIDAFLAYKERLIEYLERFIGELVIATAEIAATLRQIDHAGVGRLLEITARRERTDTFAATDDDRQTALRLWQGRWSGLRAWFIRRDDAPSQAEVLRARARSAIPALLSAVAAIHDRRVSRTDRATDLCALARWFAQTESDEDAHRLWRAAFGLAPSRHLRVDQETLDDRDSAPVSAQTSWLEAPPLRMSPRLRKAGRYARGVPKPVIDRSGEKKLLSDLARAEAEQIAAAQQRLATGQRLRLSEIGTLEPAEFNLFLDILGDALASKVHRDQEVEVTSHDGALQIKLAPTGDGATAVVVTAHGCFAGPDHFIEVHNRFGDNGHVGAKRSGQSSVAVKTGELISCEVAQ